MTYLFENQAAPIEFVKKKGAVKAYLDFSSGIGVTNLAGLDPASRAHLARPPNLYLSFLQEQVAQELAGSYNYWHFSVIASGSQ